MYCAYSCCHNWHLSESAEGWSLFFLTQLEEEHFSEVYEVVNTGILRMKECNDAMTHSEFRINQ